MLNGSRKQNDNVTPSIRNMCNRRNNYTCGIYAPTYTKHGRIDASVKLSDACAQVLWHSFSHSTRFYIFNYNLKILNMNGQNEQRTVINEHSTERNESSTITLIFIIYSYSNDCILCTNIVYKYDFTRYVVKLIIFANQGSLVFQNK